MSETLELELAALGTVGRTLEPLAAREQQRLMDWAWDRFVEQPARDAERWEWLGNHIAWSLRLPEVRFQVAIAYEEVFGA